MSIPIAKSMTPLAKSMTPAEAGVFFPSKNLSHLPPADVYTPSPFMERGWPTGRGEVKRAGGEVKRAGDEVKIYKNEKRPKLNSFDHFLKKTREK